ncbi:EAL domain-containing protein [Salmonella enterica subsp. enterica serovar Infantis]|nr:EAL domain-containing protein [Salmonella enterica subsp. enterica serovar Infantis]
MNGFPEKKMILILEITEREKVLYSKNEEENIKRLRAHGIKISLDDFGTGYSSYVYLQQFPVDFIKIDQIFVHKIGIDENTEFIISNIISLGRKLKFIAEGVETFEQADYLKDVGIHYLQGYVFGRPVSINEFIENF